jgi:hypothetical protein
MALMGLLTRLGCCGPACLLVCLTKSIMENLPWNKSSGKWPQLLHEASLHTCSCKKKLETDSTVAIRIKQCSCATFFAHGRLAKLGCFRWSVSLATECFARPVTRTRTHTNKHTRTVNCSRIQCQYQTNEGCLENETYQNLNWPFPSQIVASVQDVKNMKLTTI